MTMSPSPVPPSNAEGVAGPGWTRVFPVFSVAFMLLYVLAVVFHPTFTLFAYAPRLNQWFLGVPALGARGPGMFWYSWLTTAAVGGALAAGIALAVPRPPAMLRWSGWTWIVPLLLVCVVGYELRPWFGFR